jgi:hypothetical protein
MKITANLAKLAVIGAATSLLPFFNITSASAETVPNCVKTSLNDRGFTDHLSVTNNCKRSVRAKVVLAFKTDKACRTIAPGTTAYYEWVYPGRFDRLDAC